MLKNIVALVIRFKIKTTKTA